MSNDLKIKKGETLPVNFTVTLTSGSAKDLTDFSGTAYVKTDNYPTSTTLIEKAVTITAPATGGIGSVSLTSTETNTLPVNTYYYSIVFYNGTTGEVIKPIEGTITVSDDITYKGYTNEDLVEAEIGTSITTSTTPSSLQVSEWIKEAESLIDETLGMSFSSGTATNVVQSFDEHTAMIESHTSISASPGNDYYMVNPQNSVYLLDSEGKRVYPILSITALYRNTTTDTTSDSWQLLTENTGSGGDFVVDKLTGFVTFNNNAPYYPRRRAIKWSGTYGHSNVPLRIRMLATKMVAQRVLQNKVKKNFNANTDSYTLEGFSKRKELSQNVNYLQELDREIDRLWSKVSGSFQSEVVK